MLKNYIKIAFRNLIKRKLYTFINVMGLAVGMACCLLIFFWVQDELSYDRFNSKIDRLYRVRVDISLNGVDQQEAASPAPAAETLKNDFPEVEQVTRMSTAGSHFISYRENSFKAEHMAYADSTLFEVFTIPLLKGNPKTALTQPNSIIIDETTAKKIFGKENPLGKTLTLDKQQAHKVTGVFKNLPQNSHFHYSAFFSMATIKDYVEEQDWGTHEFYTYVVLKENASTAALEAKFPNMVGKYIGPLINDHLGITMDEFEKKGNGFRYYLQPVKDIHLHSKLIDEHEANGSITYVYIFSAMAFIILLIACINYMNLATARSAERAKEVGIRKSAGAFRSQLLVQFLSESFILSLLSFLLAIGLVEISLPAFNHLASKSITSNYLNNPHLLITIPGIILMVGIISGAYPAFFLSASDPAK
ncbi:ABC transporter permease, partial [Xanthovirga aplysinae]|uniref:ABC transporter permease n=1 Tax=Xanthovirga aplysinae TaxID=2529853 RepID=UPI0012BD13B1